MRSSKLVALVLVGSISVLWGFKSCLENGYYDNHYGDGTTRPSSSGGGGRYFWGSGRGWSSGGASGMHSGTSRGGFGGSGHASS